MSLYFRSLTLVLAGLAGPLGALAQSDQAPPATSPSQSSAPSGAAPSKATPASAQSEAGEPRAATSADAAAPAEGPPAAAAPATGAPAAARPAAATSAHTSAHPPAGAAAAGSAHAASGSAQGGKTAADRLELGTATVTGDREQPKVMYIVPWKRSDIGDLSGKPMNSLLDEALAPVDRDEFKRQVMYYQVVKADASQNGASKAPAAQGEK
jgi:hypothetical protein